MRNPEEILYKGEWNLHKDVFGSPNVSTTIKAINGYYGEEAKREIIDKINKESDEDFILILKLIKDYLYIRELGRRRELLVEIVDYIKLCKRCGTEIDENKFDKEIDMNITFNPVEGMREILYIFMERLERMFKNT